MAKPYLLYKTSNNIYYFRILMEISLKYSVVQVVGYIKGKSALYIARRYGERQRYFTGQHMWARGYFVSTVGLDEEIIRKYIREQEKDNLRQDELQEQLGLYP